MSICSTFGALLGSRCAALYVVTFVSCIDSRTRRLNKEED